MFNNFRRAAICLATLLSVSSAHAATVSVTPDVSVFDVLVGDFGSIDLTITATLSPGEVFDHIEFDAINLNMIFNNSPCTTTSCIKSVGFFALFSGGTLVLDADLFLRDVNGAPFFSATAGAVVIARAVDSIDPTPTETPIPAALPLFASGLGALGLLTWRRKRQAVAA